MSRVLVYGNTKHPADAEMADVAHAAAAGEAIPCETGDLIKALENARTCSISILDIYYHGAPGTISLGRYNGATQVLFASDKSENTRLTGYELVDPLRKYLAPSAHVRLLGCNTAVGSRGRMLIYKLASEIGAGCVVSGTIGNLERRHFRAGRFVCESLLFSSLAAIDGEAPTWDRRLLNEPVYPFSP